MMNRVTVIYAGIGLAALALALVGWAFLKRRSQARLLPPRSNFAKSSRRVSPSGSVPTVSRPSSVSPEEARLEAQLRNAIFRAESREGLIQDAMRSTSGNRAAAIRKVLNDLHADNNRWS
jgi:hypothetical protein